MGCWILLGLLCPPLIPVILLLGLLDGMFGGGGGGGNAYRPPHPKPPALPPSVDPLLFRPVTPETDDAFLPAAGGAVLEAPGALCLVCGEPKAAGNHDH